MNNPHNNLLKTILTITLLASTVVGVAQANESNDKEAKELTLFNQAKISLVEAIKAAEHKTGGKALEAELNDESNTVQFEVEVLKDGKVHDVIVDGKTGIVLKVSLDGEASESTENEKE
jgi:uncharacterized membrane protein YkoI